MHIILALKDILITIRLVVYLCQLYGSFLYICQLHYEFHQVSNCIEFSIKWECKSFINCFWQRIRRSINLSAGYAVLSYVCSLRAWLDCRKIIYSHTKCLIATLILRGSFQHLFDWKTFEKALIYSKYNTNHYLIRGVSVICNYYQRTTTNSRNST